MASQSSSVPLIQVQRHTRARIPRSAVSMRTALVIFASLLLLFGWLHFILAQKTATTGLEIQLRTEELEKLEREISILQNSIAEACSPEEMERRAYELGFRMQEPIYLMRPQATAPPTGGGQ